MAASGIYRSLLLALLPLVAVLIYVEGQRYDPALIDFRSFQGGGSRIPALPREIGGLSLLGRVRLYTRDNLYEYIDGHAEYFIDAGFVSLAVAEYGRGGAGRRGPDAVVEVYDMGRGMQAFGVLADEAGEAAAAGPGMTRFRTSGGISFITGRYYVKVNAYGEGVPVEGLAEAVERSIGGGTEGLELFSRFPDAGEVVATRFVKEGYRGLGFLHDVLEREYLLDGGRAQVFLVAGGEEEIRGLTASFLEFFRRSGIEYVTAEDGSLYKVKDPYEGEWYLLPSGDLLFGVFGDAARDMVKELTRQRGGG